MALDYGNGDKVQYTYSNKDWGVPLTVTATGDTATALATYNPLRYRGYVYDTETGLYYLQSRYYDPAVGRFINADAFASTGQGILSNNMLAYCCNSPVLFLDSSGNMLVHADILRGSSRTGGYSGGGGLLAIVGGIVNAISSVFTPVVTTTSAAEASTHVREDATAKSSNPSESIDWEGGDKRHILHGTDGLHRKGWKRFGIDPNGSDDKNWALLLPILKEIVDDVVPSDPVMNKNGTYCIYYTKVFVEQGVEVVVKIWTDASGAIQKISDAIPYVIDG